jgi:hypothetical protein
MVQKKREKSNDIIDFLLGSVIIPLAMHFVVESLLWADRKIARSNKEFRL